MSVKRSPGLGRNLSALLGHNFTPIIKESSSAVTTMSLNLLQPGKYQPRRTMNEENLQELAQSIKQQGLLQPILIREIEPQRYEIIAGERRWRACQLAGLFEAPVIIRQVNDETAMAMALIENLQREDLNPIEQARAIARLTEDFSLTHQQVADLLSKSRASISNFLRLLSLADDVISLLELGDLDMGHARALLTLEKNQQINVARLIIAQNLSVRETEKLVARVSRGELSPPSSFQDQFDPSTQETLENLARILNTKIKLKPGKSGKGSLVIQYQSVQSLKAIITELKDKLTLSSLHASE